MTYRNKKLRESARGQDCQLQIPGVCNHDPETVVWCHLNGHEFGKGASLKAHDIFGFYGCSACHDVYDGRHNSPLLALATLDNQAVGACFRSLRIACDEGVI